MNPAKYLASLLPTWRDYRSLRRTWRGDLVAGLTVGIVALPLALAFGVSSVPPEPGAAQAPKDTPVDVKL